MVIVLSIRLGIDFIEEPSAVVLVLKDISLSVSIDIEYALTYEDASEPPRLFLHWLNVLDFHQKYITRLGGLNLERSGQVMNPC